MEEASFGEGGYLVMVAQVGVEDEPEIAGGGGGVCVGSWGERELRSCEFGELLWAADDQEVGLGGVQSKEVCSHPAGD